MSFFEKPILNSPYFEPAIHWELDADGRPTDQIIERPWPESGADRQANFSKPV